MDERAVVDQIGDRLIVGGDASASGVGGSPRNGAVEAAVFDLQTGSVQRTELLPTGTLGSDDRSVPQAGRTSDSAADTARHSAVQSPARVQV